MWAARFSQVSPTSVVVLAAAMWDAYAYFVTALTLVEFASRELGATDVEAGTLYGVWGAAMGAVFALVGPLVDRLGVRRSMLVGAILATIGRLALAIAERQWHAYVALLALQTPGRGRALGRLTPP